MPTPTTDPHSEEEIQFTNASPSTAHGPGFWPPTSLNEEKMESIEDDDGDKLLMMPKSPQTWMTPNEAETFHLHPNHQRNPEMPQQELLVPTAVMPVTMRSWKIQTMDPQMLQTILLILQKLTSL
jgi:hypothetical protein